MVVGIIAKLWPTNYGICIMFRHMRHWTYTHRNTNEHKVVLKILHQNSVSSCTLMLVVFFFSPFMFLHKERWNVFLFFLAYFSYFKMNNNVILPWCVCGCPPHNKFWTGCWIIMKPGMIVMPLQATPSLYLYIFLPSLIPVHWPCKCVRLVW